MKKSVILAVMAGASVLACFLFGCSGSSDDVLQALRRATSSPSVALSAAPSFVEVSPSVFATAVPTGSSFFASSAPTVLPSSAPSAAPSFMETSVPAAEKTPTPPAATARPSVLAPPASVTVPTFAPSLAPLSVDGFVTTSNPLVERFDSSTAPDFPVLRNFSGVGQKNIRRGEDGVILEVTHLNFCVFTDGIQRQLPKEFLPFCSSGGNKFLTVSSASYLFRLFPQKGWAFLGVGPKMSAGYYDDSTGNGYYEYKPYAWQGFAMQGIFHVVGAETIKNAGHPAITFSTGLDEFSGPYQSINMTGFAEATGKDISDAGNDPELGLNFDMSDTHLYFGYEGYIWRSRIDSGIWEKFPMPEKMKNPRSLAYSKWDKKLYVSGVNGFPDELFRLSEKYFAEE